MKEYMQEKKLSQQKLAELVGLNQSTVSKHLKGKGMRLNTALKYYKVLGIPIDDLIKTPNPEKGEE